VGLHRPIVALIHFVRRRPEGYWLYIILIGGFVGSAAICGGAAPDLGLCAASFTDSPAYPHPETRTDILDNPSAANFEELGNCISMRENLKSRANVTKAIAARSDSPHTFYLRAKASIGLNDFAGAIPDLGAP